MSKLFNITYIISLFIFLCGLALFLFGIKLMSISFKGIVSYKLKNNINILTSNKIFGVVIGSVMTGLLQSSSATTLLIISLVHGNLLNIYNAVPIIMGANIGTTFTAQLVAYSQYNITPYFLMIGLVLFIIPKKKPRTIGKIILSLGLIFAAIEVISFSISPLKTSKTVIMLISNISDNKAINVFIGFLLTTVIQSSSTGVALLQVMTSNNLISVKTAIPIILGQNIGTCVNTLVGSLATNRIGKQAALIHLIFNLLGVALFYFLTDQLYNIIYLLSPKNQAIQIANAHTIYNVVTTITLLPFSSFLVSVVKKIIRE